MNGNKRNADWGGALKSRIRWSKWPWRRDRLPRRNHGILVGVGESMNINITTPPQDGTRFLLHYCTRHFEPMAGYTRSGTKWEEVRWVEARGGSEAHYEPWCGNPKIWTTTHISPSDVLAWMPLPAACPEVPPAQATIDAVLLDEWLGMVNKPVVNSVQFQIDELLTMISDRGNLDRTKCIDILKALASVPKP